MGESTGDQLARIASEASLKVSATEQTARANGYSAAGVQAQQDNLAHMANIAADQLRNEGR